MDKAMKRECLRLARNRLTAAIVWWHRELERSRDFRMRERCEIREKAWTGVKRAAERLEKEAAK